jgi:hypothetical protein
MPELKSINPELAAALKLKQQGVETPEDGQGQETGPPPSGPEIPELLARRHPELTGGNVTPGVTPPSGVVALPSKGLLYDGKLPDGRVEVSAITTREEKLIAGATGDVSSLIDALLNRLMLTRAIKPGELLLTDRLFILFNIRANSYGSKYGWMVTCRGCRRSFRHELNIPGDVEIVELDDTATEPFEVALPISGAKVGFRLLRGADEIEITRYVDSQVRKGRAGPDWGDPAYSYRLAIQITEWTPGEFDKELLRLETEALVEDDEIPRYDEAETIRYSKIALACWKPTGEKQEFGMRGKAGVEKKLAFVDNLVGMDSYAIRDAVEDADSGMILQADLKCPACQFQMREEPIPLSAEFFRPAVRESGRHSRAAVSADKVRRLRLPRNRSNASV